jgi:hypothetical protein
VRNHDEQASGHPPALRAPAARTPEELESLLEDAFITRDLELLTGLFEDGALLAANGSIEVRGSSDIAAALTSWGLTFVAGARRVLQVGDVALTLGNGVQVLRRGPDRSWRLAISLIETTYDAKEKKA